MELIDFFTRKVEAEANTAYMSSKGIYDAQTIQQYISTIIAIPFGDYLGFIKADPLSPFVLSSDVHQFSNIDAAIDRICDALSSNGFRGYKFEEIGELLQPGKTTDIVANKKYGENHVKTASDLGLCFINNGRYYLSPIGFELCSLTSYQKDQLIARLALRNNFVYTALHKALQGTEVDISDEISFLSESTVKRRKNNCLIMCRLIQRNRDINVEDLLSQIK